MRSIQRLRFLSAAVGVAIGVIVATASTLSASASGLLVPDDRNLPPLRVTDHLVETSIHDQIAITTLTQTFRNDTKQRLEATYVFPLPEQADLTNFQMTFNGKMIEGEVLPAEEARTIYESIVRQAKDPGLIEFIGRRLLRMRVFPIEPESETTIELKYQQINQPISGMRGFHYPLRTSRTSGQAYGTVRFDVSLETDAPLKNIWSPTHAVEIVRDGEHNARIAYEASGGSLEDDFILLYNTDDSDLGLSAIAHKPGDDEDGHFVLMLAPKQLWPAQEYQPQDVVFVIDTSGSMAGEKIEQARKSLTYCVDQLDERDRFSVVRFSTGFDALFDTPVEATKENRDAARKFIGDFKAAGGTNILDTLNHVVEMDTKDEARPFVVVFLTDGRGNREPDQIMQAIAKHEVNARIFPFGVGHDVNTMLLDRLSNNFKGRPVYVQPGENLELVLGDFFSVISQPVLTNLKIEMPGIGVTDRFPVTLGDLYHGQQLTIAGKFGDERTGPVKLTATRNGKQVEFVWPDVSFTNTAEAKYVPSVWAGRKIAYLVDQIRLHGESQEMIDEIISLSSEYGIQTPYTSWLVAPERQDRDIITRRRELQNRLGDVPGYGAAPRDRAVGGAVRGGGGFGGGGFGDDGAGRPAAEADETLTFEAAEGAVRDESGRAAHVIARVQASLRDADNRDAARLNRDILVRRKINDRWYIRVSGFLVDESIGDKGEMTVVKFASPAYFDLVMGRPGLRKALAAERFVVVQVTAGQAIVVVDADDVEGVTESFSDEQREQLGLRKRSEDREQ